MLSLPGSCFYLYPSSADGRTFSFSKHSMKTISLLSAEGLERIIE